MITFYRSIIRTIVNNVKFDRSNINNWHKKCYNLSLYSAQLKHFCSNVLFKCKKILYVSIVKAYSLRYRGNRVIEVLFFVSSRYLNLPSRYRDSNGAKIMNEFVAW